MGMERANCERKIGKVGKLKVPSTYIWIAITLYIKYFLHPKIPGFIDQTPPFCGE